MSDVAGGPDWEHGNDGKWYAPGVLSGAGWWKASDEVWYPPNLVPDVWPEPPLTQEQRVERAEAKRAMVREQVELARAEGGQDAVSMCLIHLAAASTEVYREVELRTLTTVMAEEGFGTSVREAVIAAANVLRKSVGGAAVNE